MHKCLITGHLYTDRELSAIHRRIVALGIPESKAKEYMLKAYPEGKHLFNLRLINKEQLND